MAETVPFAKARGTTLVLFADAPVRCAASASGADRAGAQPRRQRGALLAARFARRSAPWSRRRADLLQVDDAGPGIAAADRERVFDRFYRRAAGDDGTGLGLAIVRSVAERHGATVTLGASPLGGLRVTVRFAPARTGPDAGVRSVCGVPIPT